MRGRGTGRAVPTRELRRSVRPAQRSGPTLPHRFKVAKRDSRIVDALPEPAPRGTGGGLHKRGLHLRLPFCRAGPIAIRHAG
jgi:hypothetical protein